MTELDKPDMNFSAALLFRLACLFSLVGVLSTSIAVARPDVSITDGVPRAELVVFEVEGCGYCQLFRRDVWPGYRISSRHTETPLRFIDVRKTDLKSWQLNEPVRVVPTMVILKDGREIGRLTGYTGPEAFFQQIRHILSDIAE